jgi:hypothetical protein
MPKIFSDSGIIQIPPNPPLEKGGTTRNCGESSPFLKGDLGEFENLQGERIYGKRYKWDTLGKHSAITKSPLKASLTESSSPILPVAAHLGKSRVIRKPS